MSDIRPLLVTIGENPPDRLDKALARDVPEHAALSRSRLARLIAEGSVARDGRPVTDLKAKVAEGEVYAVNPGLPETVATEAQDIALSVVWEDDHLIVIDKPAGMVVHPAPGSHSGTLVNALLHHCGDSLSGIGGEKRPGIVHRIDKDTTGLLVVAKSDRAHHALAAQFEAHTVTRRYIAVVYGLPQVAEPRLHGVRGLSFEPGGVIHAHRPPQDRPPAAGRGRAGRAACRHALPGSGPVRHAAAGQPRRMLAGNRPYPPDSRPPDPCRPWADRRSGLWRAAQVVARCGRAGGCRRGSDFPAPGPARGQPRL
jgi:16S rRNA U516 pseudouridylate synthase RsuA-like enzyme